MNRGCHQDLGRAGRARGVRLLAVLAGVASSQGACEESAHRDIQDEINILTRRNDALVPPATARLARFNRIAIPQIETALHTAAPTGRLHLIEALERIGDDEAVPILRHFAVYDTRPEVRRAATDVLAGWAQPSSMTGGSAAAGPRAERARAAQTEIARKIAAGESPLVFEGGTPGVPTVGAPEPVGSDLEKPR
ncbi:MAG: HEAT repeat domain-containing protein [Pseudomonadota bacterium]